MSQGAGQAPPEEKLVRGTVQSDEHDNFDMFLPGEQSSGLSRQIDKSISDLPSRTSHFDLVVPPLIYMIPSSL